MTDCIEQADVVDCDNCHGAAITVGKCLRCGEGG